MADKVRFSQIGRVQTSSRIGASLALALAVAMAGCAEAGEPSAAAVSEHASAAHTPSAEPTPIPTAEPTANPAEAILAECADVDPPAGEPVALLIRANSSGFNKDRLEGPRHCEPFTITLTNADLEVEHNVAVEPMDSLGATIDAMELVRPRQSETYEFAPMPAGEYQFLCQPHRSTMKGILVVAPAP